MFKNFLKGNKGTRPKPKVVAEDESMYINILLLGETGTGKSTFINSFANYLQYACLSDAEEETKLICLIPTKFSVATQSGGTQVIHFEKEDNEDKSNEDNELGNSSTKAPKAYVFPFEANSIRKKIRIIDTPGINDSRGAVTKDRENLEMILDYIGQFTHIHLICFLLKPDVTVLTAAFKYCLVELFSRLDRSAADNIAFLFTRTRSTFYKAPDTITCVRRVLKEIADTEGVNIPLRTTEGSRNNCFYFDNEGFKYLVAREKGVHMGQVDMLTESWDVSYTSSWGIIYYLLGDEKHSALKPHKVQDTVSVNRARTLILELAKPLAECNELVQDNLDELNTHKRKLETGNLSHEDLVKMLYVPVVDLEETKLDSPVTVCTAKKCSEIYTVGELKKNHFKQRCHNPCYLDGITKNLIGDPGLIHCWAMNGSNCTQCGCDFSIHMHVYYETRTISSRMENKSVVSQMSTSKEIIDALKTTIANLEKQKREYEEEYKQITVSLATFAYFLNTNSICPINDAYEEYLDYLIQREKVGMGSNKELMKRYQSLRKEHIEQKNVLIAAGKEAKKKQIKHVTSNEILEIFERLKNLKHTGKIIKGLHRRLLEGRRGELVQNSEFVYPKTATKPVKKQSKVVTQTTIVCRESNTTEQTTIPSENESIEDLVKAGKVDEAMAKMKEDILKTTQEERELPSERPQNDSNNQQMMNMMMSMCGMMMNVMSQQQVPQPARQYGGHYYSPPPQYPQYPQYSQRNYQNYRNSEGYLDEDEGAIGMAIREDEHPRHSDFPNSDKPDDTAEMMKNMYEFFQTQQVLQRSNEQLYRPPPRNQQKDNHSFPASPLHSGTHHEPPPDYYSVSRENRSVRDTSRRVTERMQGRAERLERLQQEIQDLMKEENKMDEDPN